MAEIKLLADTGHFESIAAEIDALERDIRATGYPPLLVDFLMLLDTDLANAGVPSAQTAHSREALRVAQSAGYEEGTALALAAVAWSEYRNPAVADLALEQAEAVVHHLGDPSLSRAWLETDFSFIQYAQGRLADSLRHAERALAIKQQRTPPDPREVGLSESNICLILATQDRAKEALPHCDRSMELVESVLGWSHPSTVNLAENRVVALTELGRFDEGCRLADRIRAFFEERGEQIVGRVTLVPTLGRCAVNRGAPNEARALLERAFAAATRASATAMEIAAIEWELARATYACGDRAGAGQIANRAARRYAALPELAFREREIRAWRADHRDLDR